MISISLSRRAWIRAVSFLAAGFLVLGGFLFTKHRQVVWYQQQQALSGQHAFAELATAVDELDTALQKGLYSTSVSTICSICTEIYAKTQMAQMALGDLPYANVDLEQTASFLAKLGDFACALSASAARNGGVSEDERNSLAQLCDTAGTLAQHVDEVRLQLAEGELTLESLEQATARLSSVQQDSGAQEAGTVFQNMEEEFPEVPTLIYDGPFSQHLTQRTPLGLEGLEEVTQEQAQQAAADFLGVRPEVFTLTSVMEGELPSYAFSASLDGGEVYISVTRQGGKVVELFTSRAMGQPTLSFEDGVALADAFLVEHGYSNMEESYYIDQQGLLTIHYAAVQDGVLCYPDLLKVSVALDTGRVVGFESAGYWWNHTQRQLDSPAVTQEQARQAVSPLLEILSVQTTLIPTSGQYEVLCYEFKCQAEDGRHYIVYVNAQTGQEEHILILIEDENGTLVL